MRMRPRIKAIKHYVQVPAATIGSGSVSGIPLITTVAEGAARATTATVEEGSTISALYVEWWISGVTADKTVNWFLVVLPSGVSTPTVTNALNMQAYDNKKNILKAGQGLAPTGGNTVPILREWVKLPRGKQRFGLGDKLMLLLNATGTTVNHCGFATYKEQT